MIHTSKHAIEMKVTSSSGIFKTAFHNGNQLFGKRILYTFETSFE